MVNYFNMVVVSKADYEATENPELWESHTAGDYIVFGLAINIEEQDDKYRIARLDDNVHSPIQCEIDAYLAGIMQVSPTVGEDIIVVVDTDADRYNAKKVYDLINSGQFYEAYTKEDWS